MNNFLLFIITVCFISVSALAQTDEQGYFASLRNGDANIRTGPNVKYPIRWVYQRKHWPVKVTASFEGWRKISDYMGEIGWVHETILSHKRYVVIRSTAEMEKIYRLPMKNSDVELMAEDGVIAELLECNGKNWCRIRSENHKGWIESGSLWGVAPNEKVE